NETSMTAPNDNAIRRALEAAGVEFIDEDGAGPRVRLRKRQGKKAYSRAFFHQRYAVTRRNQPGASRAIEDITIAEVARTGERRRLFGAQLCTTAQNPRHTGKVRRRSAAFNHGLEGEGVFARGPEKAYADFLTNAVGSGSPPRQTHGLVAKSIAKRSGRLLNRRRATIIRAPWHFAPVPGSI